MSAREHATTATREREGVLNVGATLGSRQAGLRRAAADATKCANDRQAEMLGEIVGLIEAALQRA